MSLTLTLMLALPLIGALGLFIFTRNTGAPWFTAPLSALGGMVLVGIVFAASFGASVGDVEIWSGKVVGKERMHGSYEQAYSCMCTTDSKGNQTCQTCYETHYTVDWIASSTIGKFTIDAKDSTYRRVYNTPDPLRYIQIQNNDPVSKKMPYTNYVQAVPESLFAASPKELTKHFAALLPPYPDQIYDIYRVNRFISPGFGYQDAAQWNEDISLMLRDLGPAKQVNVIVTIAKTADQEYALALRDHWEGVNKNDVVVVIGSEDGQKIAFVNVLSWTKNELFKIQLADTIAEMETIDRTKIIPAIGAQIAKNFERRRMREFAYLKGEINPPGWLIVTTVLLLLTGYVGGTIFLNKADASTRYPYRRYRR